MNGIVVVTTDSGVKREFTNCLYEESGGKVDLVIVQRTPGKNFFKRVSNYVGKVGIVGLPRELFFTLRWLFSRNVRNAEMVFSLRTGDSRYARSWFPRTLMVESINTEKVRNEIFSLSPKLIVIWGGMIVKENILNCAPKVINMHSGWCPEYRGVNGNQHAILNNDWGHVGFTIHYAIEKVDAGGILEIVPANTTKPTPELFRDLNNRGESKYRDIALRLFHGEEIPSKPQDVSRGKNYRLKEWTYEKKYKLGRLLLKRDSGSNF